MECKPAVQERSLLRQLSPGVEENVPVVELVSEIKEKAHRASRRLG